MGSPSSTSQKNILLLSSGSKVAIARIAKTAAARRGAELVASDTQPDVPSRLVADSFNELPDHTEAHWGDALLELCRKKRIGLIIPTRHNELLPLSQLKPQLADQGVAVSICSPNAVATCIHKLDTFRFLSEIGAPTPATALKSKLSDSPIAGHFPLFTKPESGAASANIRIIRHKSELQTVPDDWILQPVANGQEYTVNLYLNRDGQPLCAIPHQRLVVESGEVAQARTERLPPLIAECERVASHLTGAEGIINIQAFHDPQSGEFEIIEINPRIGGGYPLCDAAKGYYIEWLCQEHLDNHPPQRFDQWTENLLMMRYRDAFFSL